MIDPKRPVPEESDEPELDDTELNQDPESVDPDVKDIFEEAQDLDYGREDLTRKLETYTDRTPELTGGDVDASWEYADVGEETVGGQNPTPDQSVVDEEGEAVGLTYQDNEQLAVDDKVGKRDRDPWELNPASTPDYPERVREEFQAPLESLGITPEPSDQKRAPKESKTKAATKSRRTRSQKSRQPAGAATMRARSPGGNTKNAQANSTRTQSAKGTGSHKTKRAKGSGRAGTRR